MSLIKKKLAVLALMVISQGVAAAESGEKIAREGNGGGATACAVCHGVDGAGQAAASFPRLAGLDKDYLAKQLVDFKSGSRNNPIMQPIASALTAGEVQQVAKYYSELKLSSSPVSGDAALLARGKQLAQRGAWDKDVPACVSCHGPDGMGVGKNFPALAGQHASYISQQINAWKSGVRKNDPVELMKVVAERLSEEEVKAVAAYFASLPAIKE